MGTGTRGLVSTSNGDVFSLRDWREAAPLVSLRHPVPLKSIEKHRMQVQAATATVTHSFVSGAYHSCAMAESGRCRNNVS
jgi:hypothetical protein